MTTIKWPIRFPVLLVAAMLVTINCDRLPVSPTGPTPTPSPTPPQAQLLQTRPFNVGPDGYGFAAPTVGRNPGTYTYIARWEPQPPTGQMYLFLIRDPVGDVYACYRDFTCPQILARDVSDSHPKRIEYRVPVGEVIYFWTRGIAGEISGTVEIWFTPD